MGDSHHRIFAYIISPVTETVHNEAFQLRNLNMNVSPRAYADPVNIRLTKNLAWHMIIQEADNIADFIYENCKYSYAL